MSRAVAVTWCADVWCCEHIISPEGRHLKKTNQRKMGILIVHANQQWLLLWLFPVLVSLSAWMNSPLGGTVIMGPCLPTFLPSPGSDFFPLSFHVLHRSYHLSLPFTSINHLPLTFNKAGRSNRCVKVCVFRSTDVFVSKEAVRWALFLSGQVSASYLPSTIMFFFPAEGQKKWLWLFKPMVGDAAMSVVATITSRKLEQQIRCIECFVCQQRSCDSVSCRAKMRVRNLFIGQCEVQIVLHLVSLRVPPGL